MKYEKKENEKWEKEQGHEEKGSASEGRRRRIPGEKVGEETRV